MTIYVFEEVFQRRVKSGKCGCGVRRTRARKFLQTINPYNRNASGDVKTREEIYKELDAAGDKWMSEPITCSKCEGVP